jgi:hypothetical protein
MSDHSYDEFEDTKGVIRIRIFKNRQQHGQKKKIQKDKQQSIKHTHKTKDRETRTPLKTGGKLRCSGKVGSSCSTSGIRRVNLVTNPVVSHEWGKDRGVFTTSGTYPWLFVTQITVNQVMVATVKLSNWRLQLNQDTYCILFPSFYKTFLFWWQNLF